MEYKPINILIGSRLKELRERKNFTIRYVGDRLGKSNVTISNYETGRLAVDIPTLKKLCVLYDTNMMTFLSEIYERL